MAIKDTVQELRERVLVVKGITSVQGAALSMKISPITLRNWLSGKSLPTVETLEIIERWCDKEEAKHGRL